MYLYYARVNSNDAEERSWPAPRKLSRNEVESVDSKRWTMKGSRLSEEQARSSSLRVSPTRRSGRSRSFGAECAERVERAQYGPNSRLADFVAREMPRQCVHEFAAI